MKTFSCIIFLTLSINVDDKINNFKYEFIVKSTRILLHDASPPHTFFNAQYKID